MSGGYRKGMTPPVGARGRRWTAGPGPWCGTPGGYTNHGCRCDACRAAINAHIQSWRRRKAGARSIPDHLHGRYTTYINYKCRCDACRAAKSAYNRSWRRRKAGAS